MLRPFCSFALPGAQLRDDQRGDPLRGPGDPVLQEHDPDPQQGVHLGGAGEGLPMSRPLPPNGHGLHHHGEDGSGVRAEERGPPPPRLGELRPGLQPGERGAGPPDPAGRGQVLPKVQNDFQSHHLKKTKEGTSLTPLVTHFLCFL